MSALIDDFLYDGVDHSKLDNLALISVDKYNNYKILYITVGLIIVLVLLWIIILFLTKSPQLNIINNMSDPNDQINPISDNPISHNPISDNYS